VQLRDFHGRLPHLQLFSSVVAAYKFLRNLCHDIAMLWRAVKQADIAPRRYAESEGSNFDEDDDSDAEAPRKSHT
jgi:hypothetical protein